jgi:outer membrane receptor protein involved in Fe transport
VFTNPNIFGAQAALVNVPKSYVAGAEIQADLRPVPGLNITAGATYLKSKVQSEFNNFSLVGTEENFKGESFPYTPTWEVNADAEYQIPLSYNYRAFVGGSVDYRSDTKAGFGTSPLLDIAAYALVDVRAGFERSNGAWRVEIFGKNITDKYYWTNVAKFSDSVRRLPGMPATYGVSLSLKMR